MAPAVLYCSDVLSPRRVDEHFAAEAHAVRERGGRVALIDHDALMGGDAEQAVARIPCGPAAAWYRGWMMPSDRYEALAAAVRLRGGSLVVPPAQYRSAHELPGWYGAFSGITPESVWLPSAPGRVPAHEDLAAAAGKLPAGPGIVKDYVKSRKHEWDEACFVPDLADTARLAQVVRRFVDLQGDDLAGGLVLRAYESFVRPRSTATEARVWWLDGEPRLVTAHPDSVSPHPPEPELGHVRAAVRRLGCRFVTTDLALRADGVWRVVEVGDGQVSDVHREVAKTAIAGLLRPGRTATETP
ncbi:MULTISPECIES: ATP-grasp domain-containing protein [unclassified Streptomyces]|uniref:ATP-grasp domain-containing protein n=1 Tax=unclassified Streptomyces TaxID=2593676 RepID=UPI0033245D35